MLNNDQLQRIRERLSLAQREAPDTIFLPINVSLSDLDIVLLEMPSIVAEAMRRGEVKAWSEARELAKHKIGLVYRNGEADVDDKLWDSAVEAKLTSLKTP